MTSFFRAGLLCFPPVSSLMINSPSLSTTAAGDAIAITRIRGDPIPRPIDGKTGGMPCGGTLWERTRKSTLAHKKRPALLKTSNSTEAPSKRHSKGQIEGTRLESCCGRSQCLGIDTISADVTRERKKTSVGEHPVRGPCYILTCPIWMKQEHLFPAHR